MVLAMIAAFAYGGFCIYLAMQYSAIAPNQSTTTAYVLVTSGSSRNDAIEDSTCNYSFTVDGRYHGGQGRCPQQSGSNAGNSDEGGLRELASEPTLAEVTVYYDPANPSNNGLTDFNARSEAVYLRAKMSIGFGVLLILLMVLGLVLISRTSNRAGGIVVDAEGTVIHPDELFSAGPDSANNSTENKSK
jgi:hypothetical protein